MKPIVPYEKKCRTVILAMESGRNNPARKGCIKLKTHKTALNIFCGRKNIVIIYIGPFRGFLLNDGDTVPACDNGVGGYLRKWGIRVGVDKIQIVFLYICVLETPLNSAPFLQTPGTVSQKCLKMKYKRILLKLSGEALGGASGKGLDEAVLETFASEVASVASSGVQVAIVVGGGNIFRGLQGAGRGFDRVHGDQMGMLATVINSKAFAIFLKQKGVEAEVFTATPMRPIARYYMRDEVDAFLKQGGVALLSGGTGNPFFTTDSGAALRACEIGADAVLKGTKVDGVYDSDPMKNPDAVRYDEVSFDEAIEKNLKIMDQTAFTLCKENGVPVVVFNVNRPGELMRVVSGEPCGTIVH